MYSLARCSSKAPAFRVLVTSTKKLVPVKQNACRQLSSRTGYTSNDLLLKLVGGTLALGGASWIGYQQWNKSSQQSHGKSSSLSRHTSSTSKPSPPPLVANLPESVVYLIVGGGTAAYSAARAIRSNDPGSKVLMISAEEVLPYMRPPLSKELWFSGVDLDKRFTFRQWNGKEKSVFYENEEFYLPLDQYETAKNGGISIVHGHKVVEVHGGKATLDNGQSIAFQKCLIATGSRPRSLPVFQGDAEIESRVVLFRDVNDFKKLNNILANSSNVTIIGDGFLGSELAFSLAEKSTRIHSPAKITQIVPETGVLSNVLPKYLSEWCAGKIASEGKFVSR